MNISRRGFVSGSAAFAVAAKGLASGVAPGIRIGLLTDIHLFPDKNSLKKFVRALTYLRSQNVDAVVVTGDMAHTGRISELKTVATAWHEVFPGDKYPDGRPVARIFLCGNHDMSRKPAGYLKLTQEEFDRQAFYTQPETAWRECFGEQYEPISIRTVKGYKFIVAHWIDSTTIKGADSFIRAHADELRGDKPFFYLQHTHLSGTAPGHGHDNGSVAAALSEFPNAVSVCGHSHRPLTDERSMIWQGAFTAVNASSLIESGHRYSDPAFENSDRPALNGRKVGDLLTPVVDAYTGGHQGLVLDVYPERLVFHRHSFSYGEPCGADWIVPFPACPDSPFDPARRKAAAKAPQFPAGAEISVEAGRWMTRSKKEADGIKVSFPLALGQGEGGRAYAYEVTATDPSGSTPPLVRSILSPDFNRPPSRLLERASIIFAASELPAGEKTRFTVRPFDSYHNYGAALGVHVGDGEVPPLFRVGIMSDTHVGTTLKSCEHVRAALQLFKSKNAELVINCGDIADHYFPSGYRAYRQTVDEVYAAEKKPQEIFVYAWHDAYRFKEDVPRGDTEKYSVEAFEKVREHLKAPHGHTEQIEFKGYPFLVFPQHIGFPGFIGYAEYEERIAAACKAYPGKPVFVVDHTPARGTTYNANRWGDSARLRVLDKFPQVVALNGHTHGTLQMHHQIWQGRFTAINAACLHLWGGGKKPRRAYGVLTMDVYPEKLVVRRWDIRDGREIRSDRRWIVPLPFEPEKAPLNHANLAASIPATAFARGAKAIAELNEDGTFSGGVSYPQTGEDTLRYRIEAQKRVRGEWRTYAWDEIWSEFCERPTAGHVTRSTYCFPEARLDPGVATRFLVSPVSHFGKIGLPIATKAVKTPKATGRKKVFATDDPSRDLAYVYAKGGGRIACGADGFHMPSGAKGSRLELPAGVFSGPAGTIFRVTLDMRTVQPKDAWLWGVWLVDPVSGKPVSPRQGTPDGDSGDQRWILELVKSVDVAGETYHVGFDWGTESRVRFKRILVERLES